MNITIEDLITALTDKNAVRAHSMLGLKSEMERNPDAEMGVIISLTGAVSLYDLTAQVEPLLVFSANLSQV